MTQESEIDLREKPKSLYRIFSRIPLYLYRLGLSRPFEANNIMVLTTKGRKTGRGISTPLGFVQAGNAVFIPSVYKDSDWLMNARKDPEVQVQIGKVKRKALAEIEEDPDQRAKVFLAMMRAMDEKNAEKYYYVKPGMDDDQVRTIGRSLHILRLRFVD